MCRFDFTTIERKNKKEICTISDALDKMIGISDNEATDALAARVGYDGVNALPGQLGIAGLSDKILPEPGIFGKALRTYDLPDGFSGSYRRTDFDGFKFLVYEMFVSLIASLLRNNRWDMLGNILAEDLFVEKVHNGGYVSFERVSAYVGSLDGLRNSRLKKNRISIMGDIIKERFTNSELSQLLSHKELLEAGYFLFMRTVCHIDDAQHLYGVWCPRACVWLERAPSYIIKAESKRFLATMLPATGFSDEASFKENLINKHGAFTRYFSSGWKDDPLEFQDLEKLGTRK